jgi:hypothetical protein
MYEVFKNQLNLDAHMYEIDKSKLKDVYNITERIKKQYNIVEKKLIYAVEEGSTTVDVNKKYFSSYKFFREYLSTGFESNDIYSEIKETKELLKHSKSIRENLEKLLGPADGEGNQEGRKTYLSKFIKMCKLLTPKDEKKEDKQAKVFKIYSELDKPSDVYSFALNEGSLNNQMVNSKRLLTEGYNMEEYLDGFAKNYNKANPAEQIMPESKKGVSNEYINSIFRARDSEAFYNIDSFMSTYGISQKVNLHEKDLYENIYTILSKCKYMNFLSFLYSKNDVFKFVYDDFVLRKVGIPNTLDDVKLSRIDSVETERFFKGDNISIHPERSHKRKHTLSIDELLNNNHFFDKISFLNEKIDAKLIEPFVKPSEEKTRNALNPNMAQYVKILNLKENNFLFQITKTDKLKISCLEDDGSGKIFHGDIEEPLKKISIYKIRQEYVEKMNIFEEGSVINSAYMILEISNTHFRRNSDSANLINFGYNCSFYLFKVSNDNVKRFDLTIENFKLSIPTNKRVNRLSTVHFKEIIKRESISDTNKSGVFETKTNDDRSGSFSSPDVVHVERERTKKPSVRFVKQNNIIQQLDEDFLGRNNKDILTEVLRSKGFGKHSGSTQLDISQVDDSRDITQKPQVHDDIEDNENNKLRNLVKYRRSSFLNPEEVDIAFRSPQFSFKINRDEYKFAIVRDGLEYYKVGDATNKTFKEFSLFKDYITSTLSTHRFKGIVQIRFLERSKGDLELITSNESEYKDFIARISGYLHSIDNKN